MWHNLQVSITSEDNRAVESKGIGRKLIDRLYQTYSSEFAGKRFAYDGEKSLYTVGPLPQNKSEFTVVLEESFAKQYVILPQTSLVFLFLCVSALHCIPFRVVVKVGALVVVRALLQLLSDQSALISQRLLR